MSVLGLAWDLQPVPERIYREARDQTETRIDPEAMDAQAR
jgi:hypothetical protein